jgi:hypothetical protein
VRLTIRLSGFPPQASLAGSTWVSDLDDGHGPLWLAGKAPLILTVARRRGMRPVFGTRQLGAIDNFSLWDRSTARSAPMPPHARGSPVRARDAEGAAYGRLNRAPAGEIPLTAILEAELPISSTG